MMNILAFLPLAMLVPEIRWLNQQGDRLLTVDSDNFSLYTLDEEEKCNLVGTCTHNSFSGINLKPDHVILQLLKSQISKICRTNSGVLIWITHMKII
jgi:hypothetical protein